MLEKPGLEDGLIIACLQDHYRLQVSRLAFIPLGADVNSAVYRALTVDGTAYFVKLRKGAFDPITVAVPRLLKAQGLPAIIAPLETRDRQSWASLAGYKMILYPFVEGLDGYKMPLSDRQWLAFGAALRGVHTAHVPPELARLIPREDFSLRWREKVKTFQSLVAKSIFEDPDAAELAAFMQSKHTEISRLVKRANELANALISHSSELVLCHSDIHAGNLLLGEKDALYIVDWDNPLFAPKERDLMMVGGSAIWSGAKKEALFYQGYGQAMINPTALAYYRYERVIQDIAEFCQQLLLTKESGKDRQQSVKYFISNFLPGHEIEIAFKTDELLSCRVAPA